LRLLRLLHVVEKTQKSLPISEPFLVKTLEKRRVKREDVSALGDDFCILLVGPPRGACKSKTPFARASGEGLRAATSVVDPLDRRRQRNSKAPNEFGIMSPKTRQATKVSLDAIQPMTMAQASQRPTLRSNISSGASDSAIGPPSSISAKNAKSPNDRRRPRSVLMPAGAATPRRSGFPA
jgi:hypothetical protein